MLYYTFNYKKKKLIKYKLCSILFLQTEITIILKVKNIILKLV